jgi:hypothetical protein
VTILKGKFISKDILMPVRWCKVICIVDIIDQVLSGFISYKLVVIQDEKVIGT